MRGDPDLTDWILMSRECGDMPVEDADVLLQHELWHDYAEVGASHSVRLTFSADVEGSEVSRQLLITPADWNGVRSREPRSRQLLQTFVVAVLTQSLP